MRGHLEYKTQLFKKGKGDTAPTPREAAARLLPLGDGELRKGREKHDRNAAQSRVKSPEPVCRWCPCPAWCLRLAPWSPHQRGGGQSFLSKAGRPRGPEGAKPDLNRKGCRGGGRRQQRAGGLRLGSVLSRYPMGARRVLAGRGQLRWPWARRRPSAGAGNGGGQRHRAPSAAGAVMLGTAMLRAAPPGPLHGPQAGQQATSGDRGKEEMRTEVTGPPASCGGGVSLLHPSALPTPHPREASPGPAAGVRACFLM